MADTVKYQKARTGAERVLSELSSTADELGLLARIVPYPMYQIYPPNGIAFTGSHAECVSYLEGWTRILSEDG